MRKTIMPFLEAHQLLNLAPDLVASPDFDLEEHNRLFKKHYPPQTDHDINILEQTCMGWPVDEHQIRNGELPHE